MWFIPTQVYGREVGAFFPAIPEAKQIKQIKAVSS